MLPHSLNITQARAVFKQMARAWAYPKLKSDP